MDKSARNYKFLFGDRIVKIELDLMERLIEAYYSKDKLRNLRLANIEIEKLRQLMSVCVQMRFMSAQQLEFATRELNQIGSLVGGWIRQQETHRANAGVV